MWVQIPAQCRAALSSTTSVSSSLLQPCQTEFCQIPPQAHLLLLPFSLFGETVMVLLSSFGRKCSLYSHETSHFTRKPRKTQGFFKGRISAIQNSLGILFQLAGAYFLGPIRWHCLTNGIFSMPTLSNGAAWAGHQISWKYVHLSLALGYLQPKAFVCFLEYILVQKRIK